MDQAGTFRIQDFSNLIMPELWEILFLAGVLLAAMMLRSAFGFGDGLLAMPLLSMAFGIKVASPIVAIVASGVSVLILAARWAFLWASTTWKAPMSAYCKWS